MFEPGNLPPNAGQITTTVPLTDVDQVQAIKRSLATNPRELALFTLAINGAWRASDLLSLERAHVRRLPSGEGEVLTREKKTGKLRKVLINAPTMGVLETYLVTRKDNLPWLFVGQRGRLTHGYLGSMVKRWFADVGITERVASHSLRKTWARLNHKVHGVALSTLMHALGHSSERCTLQYIGLLAEDVQAAYRNAL